MRRFGNRFAAYFDNADAPYDMAISFNRVKFLNYFQDVVSSNYLLMKLNFLLVLKMINEVTGIFCYGTLLSKERIKNFYFFLDHWNTCSDERVKKCKEFFNYLKISELTNTFLLKPTGHSRFSRYMSNILAYCLQLRKQVDLEDSCLFQMFECFFLYSYLMIN